MEKKFFYKLGLGGICILIIGIGSYIFQTLRAPTETISEFENKKVYRDSRTKIEFSFPKDWIRASEESIEYLQHDFDEFILGEPGTAYSIVDKIIDSYHFKRITIIGYSNDRYSGNIKSGSVPASENSYEVIKKRVTERPLVNIVDERVINGHKAIIFIRGQDTYFAILFGKNMLWGVQSHGRSTEDEFMEIVSSVRFNSGRF